MINTSRGISEILIATLNMELKNILSGLEEQSKERNRKFVDLIVE